MADEPRPLSASSKDREEESGLPGPRSLPRSRGGVASVALLVVSARGWGDAGLLPVASGRCEPPGRAWVSEGGLPVPCDSVEGWELSGPWNTAVEILKASGCCALSGARRDWELPATAGKVVGPSAAAAAFPD